MEQAAAASQERADVRSVYARFARALSGRRLNRARRSFLAALAGVLLAACASSPPPVENTIYLVRHAEKAAGADPSLTLIGRTRADILAQELSGAGLTSVFSTSTKRTQQTAIPAAKAAGVQILYYDPQRLEQFAEYLRNTPGNILVVGHSNTTPQLVEFLGGEPGPPIDEATEFDRMYILTVDGQRIRTRVTAYGG